MKWPFKHAVVRNAIDKNEPGIGDEWQTALLEIDDKELRKNLGDVLDKDRLSALGKRRDALIRDSNR